MGEEHARRNSIGKSKLCADIMHEIDGNTELTVDAINKAGGVLEKRC
jgi:hypothetical protein